MRLKEYLKNNKITIKDFAKDLNVSRTIIHYYLRNPDKVPLTFKLAVEYITARKVKKEVWDENSN